MDEEVKVYQASDGRWLVYSNGEKSPYFNSEDEAKEMADKIKYTTRCQQFSDTLADLFLQAIDLEGIYFDEGYDSVGSNPITDENIQSLGVKAADLSSFIAVIQQIQKFNKGDQGDPVVTADYGATVNKMRTNN